MEYWESEIIEQWKDEEREREWGKGRVCRVWNSDREGDIAME